MDTLFLIASKAVWILLRPETLLVLLFVSPLILLRRGQTSAATKSLIFALSATLVIGVFPFGNLFLNPLERTYLANPQIDAPAGIIILGGAEDSAPDYAGGFAQVNHAADRLIAGVALARQFPNALILYSGGKVALTPVDQGTYEIGPDILRQLGLPEERLIVEGQSRSTAENAAFSRAMVPDNSQGGWVLVTSASHMPRALGSFCAAGWQNLIPYPTDYRGGAFWNQIGWNLAGNLYELNIGVKEWVGLLAYRLTGRTQALLPSGCT